MTKVKNTKSRGSYTKFTDVNHFQIGQYAGGNRSKKKKKLIYFENRSFRLKESTVKSFKKQHQEDLKKQDPKNDHLQSVSQYFETFQCFTKFSFHRK